MSIKGEITQLSAFMETEAEPETKQTTKTRKASQKEPEKKTSTGTRTPRKMGTIENGQLKMTEAPEGYVMRREPKSKRTSVLLRPSTYNKVVDAAGAAGVSVNEYISDLIERNVNK